MCDVVGTGGFTVLPYATLFRSCSGCDVEGAARVPGESARRGREGIAGPDLVDREVGEGRHPVHRGDGLRPAQRSRARSEEHTSELQSLTKVVCRAVRVTDHDLD